MPRKKRTDDDEDLESAYDELIDNPILPPQEIVGEQETSYSKALGVLTETEGPLLEMMTRTNPVSARAFAINFAMISTFRSNFIAGQDDLLKRALVSMGGEGRKEVVNSLSANSGAFDMPGNDNGPPMFQPAPEE